MGKFVKVSSFKFQPILFKNWLSNVKFLLLFISDFISVMGYKGLKY